MSTGKNQYLKSKVRATPAWRQLRVDIEEAQNGLDPITLRPLRKGFNVHHLDMRAENYGNLALERFAALNKSTHEMVHWLFRYYAKDPAILERLKTLLDKMVELS